MQRRLPRAIAGAKDEVQQVLDYLYLWHQPESKRLGASGIEFRDLIPELATVGGLVLIHHAYDEALLDPVSNAD